ncbi:MAG: DUF6786 family protein [Terracidiphilus sp.]
MFRKAAAAGALAFSLAAAQGQTMSDSSFGEVVAFVNRHTKLIVLKDDHVGAAIAVWPAMQGRVLTSTAGGDAGLSFGWYNRDLIASGKVQAHINAVGGEDRLWLGPEGGQFSIFFASGAPFDLAHWYTPAPLDTEAFEIVGQTSTKIAFRKSFELTNYFGTKFHVQIDREVRLLAESDVWRHLGMSAVSGDKVVGFESDNRLTILSSTSWSSDTGLLSLWILGQFEATPQTTIVLPIKPGPESELGIPVKMDYFGTVPADRIRVQPNAVFFKADANYRSKLGLSPMRAKGVSGSYDALNHVLTIVQYDQPDAPAEYVNSSWEIQAHPYQGDVANCYNDGPPTPDAPQLGHFYELESSSPARVLKVGESVGHIHRTIHLVGTEPELDRIAQQLLGVHLNDTALP